MRVINYNTEQCNKTLREDFKIRKRSFKINFSSQDIFDNTLKNEEYYKLRAQIKPKNGFIAKRFDELLYGKHKKDLSYTEAYILAHPQNIDLNYAVFSKKANEFSTTNYDKQLENYAKKCRFYGGVMFDNKDIENYLDYKQNIGEEDFKIDKALRYVSFLKGYALEGMQLDEAQAWFFANEEWRPDEIKEFYNFLNSNPKLSKIYFNGLKNGANNVQIFKTQTQKGYEISLLKSAQGSEEGDSIITLEASFGTMLPLRISRNEFFSSGKLYSHFICEPNLTIIEAYELFDKEGLPTDEISLEEIIELICNANGEPEKIIQTKKAETLRGAYEVSEYKLDNYPQDLDVLEAIKNGTIKGKKTSKIYKKDNKTIYESRLGSKQGKTSSKYILEKDKTDYTLQISSNNEALYFCKRSFETINNSKTKTTIDGNAYFCEFDNEGYVTLTNANNEKILKLSLFSSPNAVYGANDYPIFIYDENQEEKTKSFAKSLPADIIFTIAKSGFFIQIVDDEDEACAVIQDKVIYTTPNLSVLTHELAHAIDFDEENETKKISLNKELTKIYEEELKEFNKIFPKRVERKLIKYISQNGGRCEELRKFNSDDNNIIFKSAGLSELVADSFTLSFIYGSDVEAVSHRLHFAKRFFPKTISKALELLENEIFS